MRILFYTLPAYFDTTLPLVRALSGRAEVHLVLSVAPDSQRSGIVDLDVSALRPGLQPADRVFHDMFPPGVRDYWQDVASFNLLVDDCPKSIHPASWRVSRELPRLARRVRPDVLHLEEMSLRLLGALLGFPTVPKVLRVHDPEAHSGESNWRSVAAWHLIRRRVDRFVLLSERLVPAFVEKNRFAADRTDVVQLGPITFFREWLNADWDGCTCGAPRPTVLFFGRISPYKGLDVLFESLPTVAAHVPGLRVIVAGRPINNYTPPPPPTLPNGGTIEIIADYIENATLATLFRNATLVVCPYRDATQSGVVMNAYGFGVPVVATRVGGLPEYVLDGERGLLVPPADFDALAAAMTRLLTDHGLRAQLRERIGAYTHDAWGGIADKMLSVYERAVAGEEMHTGGRQHSREV